MKGLTVLLLCVVAAVQGRSAGVESSNRALATLGENPWIVHIRLAISTSGLLNSCAGSLISSSWVLTSAGCVQDARFIWIRYGVVTVINPELVTESSAVRVSFDNLIAVLPVNREVQSTANISPVVISRNQDNIPTATFCAFGQTASGEAGEQLSCFSVAVENSGSDILGQSEDGEITKYDIGAPLVRDNLQIGILIDPPKETSPAVFASVAAYVRWIETETGIIV